MSSSRPAISVRGLSKQYRIKHQGTRPSNLSGLLKGGWRHSRRGTQEAFWALKDVSFDVAEGDAVGILGRNGAGKSTLLKILSRIVDPTSGEAAMRGRLGSLLEVGTGFHPELTGRENIFLNGSILGMRRAEVQRNFDAIVDFSGVERFLDMPVKRYSSGMYVRLAFSVAAHLQADILIIDEVLAVGDVEFQQKCLKKMGDVANAGKTVLFVSHNLAAVAATTRRCIVLTAGNVTFEGSTAQAIEQYLSSAKPQPDIYRAERTSSDTPAFTYVEVATSHPGQTQAHGDSMRIIVQFASPSAIQGARIGGRILDRMGRPCAHIWLYDSEQPFGRSAGLHSVECVIPKVHLAPGHYTLSLGLSERYGGRHFDRLDAICPFEVMMYGRAREGGWPTDEYAFLEDAVWRIAEVRNNGDLRVAESVSDS